MITPPHVLFNGMEESITSANGIARRAREILRIFENVKNRPADFELAVDISALGSD